MGEKSDWLCYATDKLTTMSKILSLTSPWCCFDNKNPFLELQNLNQARRGVLFQAEWTVDNTGSKWTTKWQFYLHSGPYRATSVDAYKGPWWKIPILTIFQSITQALPSWMFSWLRKPPQSQQPGEPSTEEVAVPIHPRDFLHPPDM